MFSTLKAYAYAFFTLIGLGALAGLYAKGRKDADNANALQEQDDYIETRKRMDEARRDLEEPSDDDIAHWLRKRGGGRGGSL